ncbi:MAG: PPK2 family polyphosphate kinase [Bacteroidota bacterium]
MSKYQEYAAKAPSGLDKEHLHEELVKIQKRLFELQNLLYANKDFALLIILQGLDASGKDSTIKHVFSCVNPMGCNVKSFKAPTEEEKRHGFLWRIYQHLPEKGMIQIFNRSHYEDILVPTVHQTLEPSEIEHRYQYINSFEQHLARNRTILLKFFLSVSEEVQKEKLKRRLSDPHRRWKYDKADEKEQKNREAYLSVYEEIFRRCSPQIPWHIIPADQKWYRNYVIAKTVVEKLESLQMSYP